VLDELRPWAVVNTAGYVRVDDAELEEERCRRENATGPAALAAACSSRGLPLLTFSSDLVFDGTQDVPYVESSGVAPLNAYGRAKAEGEELVGRLHPEALVVRTSAFFGPWDAYNFVTLTLRQLASGQPVRAAADIWITATYVPHLVHAALDLLLDGESGLWHLTNAGPLTWAELACRAAELTGADEALVKARPAADLGFIAPRPRYSALASERGWIMPSLDEALAEYLAAVERDGRALPVSA
jgi:dTDP-4-dehydrorhamnose reductase